MYKKIFTYTVTQNCRVISDYFSTVGLRHWLVFTMFIILHYELA